MRLPLFVEVFLTLRPCRLVLKGPYWQAVVVTEPPAIHIPFLRPAPAAGRIPAVPAQSFLQLPVVVALLCVVSDPVSKVFSLVLIAFLGYILWPFVWRIEAAVLRLLGLLRLWPVIAPVVRFTVLEMVV